VSLLGFACATAKICPHRLIMRDAKAPRHAIARYKLFICFADQGEQKSQKMHLYEQRAIVHMK
jgi:hypothetical protein